VELKSTSLILAKLVESARFTYSIIMTYYMFDRHKLVIESQHAFVKNKSCLTNVLVFIEEISNYFDIRYPMDIIYLNFQKDFLRLWLPYVIGQAIIFLPCGFFLSSIYLSFFPRLISAAAGWMSTIL